MAAAAAAVDDDNPLVKKPWHDEAVSLIRAVAKAANPPVRLPDQDSALTPAQVNLLVRVSVPELEAKLSAPHFGKIGGGGATTRTRSSQSSECTRTRATRNRQTR